MPDFSQKIGSSGMSENQDRQVRDGHYLGSIMDIIYWAIAQKYIWNLLYRIMIFTVNISRIEVNGIGRSKRTEVNKLSAFFLHIWSKYNSIVKIFITWLINENILFAKYGLALLVVGYSNVLFRFIKSYCTMFFSEDRR